ncbi:MFS transporter [Amycolatopsis suaedae]|uniref:MFS transporter n=1 Tax=Amycolatopsis suaedae TaxID=2510978 RepID=A0A4Q7J155_9PSEU|nr:MFS transporter [Amycolatopsis suaedae]RZQ61111.1 MFS transporter [Amycolatopsis suaedae]
MVAIVSTTPRVATVLGAFAIYGALWGPYMAMLPEVRRATGATEAELGAALLVGALAAMPAMVVVGRLLDRFGRPVAVATVSLFAPFAALPSLAVSVPQLVFAVAAFGFGSGACNVVVVALASTVEVETGKRVMNRAHAVFSVAVLVCSLATGAARGYGVPGQLIAVVLAVVLGTAAFAARRGIPRTLVRQRAQRGGRIRLARRALMLCLLATLAMVLANGVQQWSAILLSDVVGAPIAWAAIAPGVFAVGMILGRTSGHWLSLHAPDRLVLLGSGVLSGTGVLVLSVADSALQGLIGTAIVGAAISVATPTAYGLIGRDAPARDRGAVIGSAASMANAGELLGPAMVGQLAGLLDLRTAMTSLIVVSVVIALLAFAVPRGGLPVRLRPTL